MKAFSRICPAARAAVALTLLIGAPVFGDDALVGDLDVFVTLPDAYQLTPDDLEARYEQGSWNRNPYFKWLTADRSRAIFQRKDLGNLKVDLFILGGTVPVEELVVDFEDGRFVGITVSIHNRGDGGDISLEEFTRRRDAVGRHLGEQLQVRPSKREARPTQGVLTQGYAWVSARGKAVLESNHDSDQTIEFLRMRLARRDADGIFEAALAARPGASVKLSELPRFVRKEDGDVFIDEIPMVDQGAKGYCVVASVQRLFEFYGISCDMHQLAQIADSDPEQGTSSLEINKQLKRIDHLFKTRFTCLAVRHGNGLVELVDGQYVGKPIPDAKFGEFIRKNIDQGIPLLWSLEVGLYPEDPPLQEQTSGGHMRMIIGYNDEKSEVIFSDSWGAGHERKRMDSENALSATRGLFVMKPTTR